MGIDNSQHEATDLQPETDTLPNFEDGKYYRVRLSKPVPLAGLTLRPDEDHTFLGEFCREVKDSISGASLSI